MIKSGMDDIKTSKEDEKIVSGSNTEKPTWFSVMINKITTSISSHFKRNKWKYIVLMFISVLVLFISRAYLHEYIMLARQYSFVVVFTLSTILSIWLLAKLKVSKVKLTSFSIVLVIGIVSFLYLDGQKYVSLYMKYNSLDIVELDEYPTTSFERPQPYDSIFVQALEKINETESVSKPDYVRVDGTYKWIMEKYPTYWGQKFLDGYITELFATSATTPSPDFSNREKVSFVTGEHLLFGKNAYNASIKSFGLWKYLNYFPTDIRRIKNDDGKWVQVVSLAKWDGFFFPHPEFAGVQIIEQEINETTTEWTKRLLIGKGKYISPENIINYKYLVGQNLNSDTVTTYIAKSFMFQKGFLAPFKGYHDGDVRIPDMPGDNNEMPYVLHFENVKGKGGLHDWFGLEPYDKGKHGLSVSVWIRSDGTEGNRVYKVDHTSEALTGMSAIGTKVMESKKNYDWSKNRPVESKPYIKVINGKPRFFAQTTIATINEDGNMAGSIPETVITDLATNKPIWVDSNNPGKWLGQVEEDMSSILKK